MKLFHEKFSWLVQMAWRDSRRNRGRLLLFMSSIVLGIAALVAINSFGDNLKSQVEDEARSLLSADIEVESRQPIDTTVNALFDSLNITTTPEISFGSMVLFIKNGGSRLVNIRAVEKDFPFYGNLVTKPEGVKSRLENNREVLVDKTLMAQFNTSVGDSVKIGELVFRIAGTVLKVPGQSGIAGSVAPPVFIPIRYMPQTGLIQRGSRLNYSLYGKYPDSFGADVFSNIIKPRLDKLEISYEDVEKRKQQVGNAYADLTSFLNLTAFIALLLGCIGVASSVHIYMKEKVNSVAILRCLGVSGNGAMGIFLVQVFAMGLLGSIIGALLGVIIQMYLPVVFSEILPFTVNIQISWSSVFMGMISGIVASMLFALFPLSGIRLISPLKALRASYESGVKNRGQYVLYVLVILLVVGFTRMQLHATTPAIIFSLALFVSFGILTLLAKLVVWGVRRFLPVNWSFIMRQGLSNLYRPNNQTLVLVITVGLGTILITTLIMSQQLLLDKLQFSARAETRPNLVVFDIQDKDLEPLKQVVRDHDMPVMGSVPVVAMRLHALNNRTVPALRDDSTSHVRKWILEHEFRCTYRDSLIDSETLIDGTWKGHVQPGDSIFISISSNFAEDAGLHVGDAVTFNVQGALMKTYVGSVRKVDFQRIQPSFLVVFPSGVLEDAPKFHVVITRAKTPEYSASLQRDLVSRFPNVNIIDLNLILQTVDEVLKKVSFIIRFMAFFSIITGILVLIGSVLISKYQRIRESVLLRTIGASRNQILGINALEYFFLGSIASLTGIGISVVLNMALAKYSFNTVLTPDLMPLLICYLSITIATMVIGLVNSREVVSKPPLEILRSENG